MASRRGLGVVFLLLSVWSAARCDVIPDGVHHMECHDRYFMTAVALDFTGPDPHFEAVDESGAYAITSQYGAKCGYGVAVVPLLGYVELRASYFSCHTENKGDKEFTFKFNLITQREGEEVAYPLNKTCSPSVPWAPREVTCGMNYMEILLGITVTCHYGTEKDNRSAVSAVPGPGTSDWEVTFQNAVEQMAPMNLSQARERGYVFDMTDSRIVFRAPYGQPDSFKSEVNGIPVETLHATMFSRQGWIVLMVELVVACSMYPGTHDNGYMIWKTPEVLYPGLESVRVSMGLNGELVEQQTAENQGYVLETKDAEVHISIPYNAEGGYRKSFVADNLYKFYVFHLFFEQVLTDGNVETVLRSHRPLITPLLYNPVFTDNRTVLEDRVFTVYLGDVPNDVQLTSVLLNGHDCDMRCSDSMTKILYSNTTHGYTLMVPFSDPTVIKQFFTKESVLQYRLDINYTLTVLGQNKPYYHLVSITAEFTDVSPPDFKATCLVSGIRFKMDHRPFDYLWDVTVGSELLTSELADQRGYVMTNDSQSLSLEVPLFTHGYEYTNINLRGFIGTFRILVKDAETSRVQTTNKKTCSFTSSELIICSTNGWITVVANVSLVIPSKGLAMSTTLLDKYCRPREMDNSRALFTFPLGGCGTVMKLGKKNVTYQNEIVYRDFYNMRKFNGNETERVTVQCTYPLESLHQLFSKFKFESDVVGIGGIIHTRWHGAGLKGSVKPTVAPPTKPVIRRPLGKPLTFIHGEHQPSHYVSISNFFNFAGISKKGTKKSAQMNTSAVNVDN